jgi:hypothetical protein
MRADLLRPLAPESLEALYEEYIRRTQAGDVPAQDAGSESDVNASDGYKDCQWTASTSRTRTSSWPHPPKHRSPWLDVSATMNSGHLMRARACEQPWRARTYACVASGIPDS